MTFAEQLREARKSAGLTQQQLAERMQMPKRTIESWEGKGKAGRAPAEWLQRLVLDEIDRIKHAADFERLYEFLMENEDADEKLKKYVGMDTYPSIIIERIAKSQKEERE